MKPDKDDLVSFYVVQKMLMALLCFLLLITVDPTATFALTAMSSEAMSNVSGREGITTDISLDASANALQFEDPSGNGTGNSGVLIFNTLNVGGGDFGSSGSTSLTGMTLDADPSQGVVIEAPSGNFSLEFTNFCVDGSSNTNCSSASAYGSPRLTNVSFDGSTLEIQGTGEGLSADLNLNSSISAFNFVDGDGYPSGSGDNASLILDNISITSTSTLTGMTLNADPTHGVVLGAPSGDFTLDVSTVCYDAFGAWSNCNLGTVYGSFSANDIDLDGSTFEFRGHGGGVTADLDLNVSVNALNLTDGDGWANGTGDGGTVLFDNMTISTSSELTGGNLDFDGNQGIVIGAPDGNTSLSVSEVCIAGSPSDNCTSASPFGGFSVNAANIDGTELRMDGRGDGINADMDLSANIDSVAWEGDGGSCSNCSGNNGRLQFGSDSSGGITVGDGTGSPATLNDLTVDVDGSDDIVVGMPSGGVSVSIDETRIGTNSAANAGIGLGARNLNLDGSTVRVGTN